MNVTQAKDILEKYRNGTCSPAEKELVEKWFTQLVETGEWQWGEGEKEQLEQLMEARLLEQIHVRRERPVHRVQFMKTARWWVAASIVLTIGLGTYLLIFNKEAKQDGMVKTSEPPHDVKAPETNRATITLAGGKTVYLDSVGNGELAMQSNVKIVKTADGQITYSGAAQGETVFNTLYNPRGSKVQTMKLSDGTQVWLNAGSSVTYPVAFVGNERRVKITGEAYFEVEHDAGKPFYVSKGNMQVQVLGTHFNVNAYDDEDAIRVTLLEGSVEVKNNPSTGSGSKVKIKPGEQALSMMNGDLSIMKGVDVESVMAWKNGYFSFDNSDLAAVMRQIARWYDVEVVYEGKIPDMRFGGDISRNSSASQVLTILEKSKVHFRIEEKKIVVLP